LKKTEDGFLLKFGWQRPGPQIIDGPIYLNLDIVGLFIEKEPNLHSEYEKMIIVLFLWLAEFQEEYKLRSFSNLNSFVDLGFIK